jgi:hypothetical protein
VIEILLTILSSAIKFAMTFPLAVFQFQFGFFETVLWTNVGGIIGIYFFAFLSEKIMRWWRRTFGKKQVRHETAGKNKKIFTRRNRRIVRIKQNYGLAGIAITTPLLLSIPVGAFLVVRYYRTRRIKFTYLILSNVFWSVVYTLFYMFWDDLVLRRA